MPRHDQSPPPAEVSGSDINEEEEEEEEDPDIEDEEEEEDPELEEEEEDDPDSVEEEYEEEEEGEEEERVEVDMDISNSPIQAHDPHNDVRQDHKSQELDGIHPSASHTDDKAYLCDSEMVKATNSHRLAGEEMANSMQIRNHLGKEVKQVDLQPRNDRKQMDSRSAGTEIRTQIMSPIEETSDRNKRPAIICDFFANGWCIRGTSCKFIHVKDNPNSTHPQPEGAVVAANCPGEVQRDEGLRDINDRSRSPGFTDALASSSGSSFVFSSHVSSEKIRFLEHIEMQRRHQFLEKSKFPSVLGEESNVGESTDAMKFHSSKDDPGFLSSLKDVGRDGQTRNWPADGYNNSTIHKGNSISMSGLHPEPGFFSNGSLASSGKYSRGKSSSHSSSMEEAFGMWSERKNSDHNSPLVSLSLNSSSSKLLTSGLFPTCHISSRTGFSLPSSYSYLDASPRGTQKLLERNKGHHSSTKSAPFSSSELEKLASTSVSLLSAELRTKISSNDWEPSVPFQPSFILPPAFLSSSGSQYDPLRDSIELPKLGNISFEASFYSERANVGNRLHRQIHGESVSGTMRPACDGDTKSMSSNNEKVLDNSCYTREHNSPATEAETVGTSVVRQNGTMTIEEKHLGPSHLKDSTKPKKTSEYQSGSSRHKIDIKVDRFRENNEVDSEHVADGDVQQEPKAVRNFRAALVDLVKELLKPKWREGSLSKDAHNKIVKKAVEKVVSAFQPHQIPPTPETVVQYMSSCRLKISKLVEGYVEKYGKS